MVEIRRMSKDDREAFLAHNERYLPTSGEDGVYFMPFDVRSGERPESLDFATLDVPLTETGWQRWFIAVEERVGVVGDLQLRGAAIGSQLHRCVLGVGLEKAWRGQGLGERLMRAGIDFARAQPTLDWIDLGVFSGNPRAKALYDKLGFVETGRVEDCFRIGEVAVTDIMMTLKVS